MLVCLILAILESLIVLEVMVKTAARMVVGIGRYFPVSYLTAMMTFSRVGRTKI
jgi:hypothetical protein